MTINLYPEAEVCYWIDQIEETCKCRQEINDDL